MSQRSLTKSKTGAAEGDLGEVEFFEHFGQGEDFGGIVFFGGCGHAAAHEAEEVEQRLGEEAGFLVVDEGDRVFALGDFGFVEIAQQRHVPEARDGPAEGPDRGGCVWGWRRSTLRRG